jgi:hypothetical protein
MQSLSNIEKAAEQHPVTICKDYYNASLHRLVRKYFTEN